MNIHRKSNRYLLFIFFSLLGLGQLQRWQLTPQLAIYLHEVVILTLVIVNAFHFCRHHQLSNEAIKWKKLVSNNLVMKVSIGLVSYLILQTVLLNLISLNLISLAYFTRFIIYFSLIFTILYLVREKIVQKTQLLWGLFFTSLIVLLLGIMQYQWLPDTRWLWLYGWDDHYYRLISTLFDPNFTGLLITMGFFLFLSLYQSTSWRTPSKLILSVIFLLGLALTYSRASYLAFGIGLSAYAWSVQKKQLLLFGALLLLSLPFLPRPASEGVLLERTASVTARLESNQQALAGFQGWEVLFGQGMYRGIQVNADGKPNHATAPDNSFLFFLTSFGIIASIAALYLLVQLMKWSGQYPVMISSLSAVLIHSLFNNSLFFVWVMSFLLILLAAHTRFKPVKNT